MGHMRRQQFANVAHMLGGNSENEQIPACGFANIAGGPDIWGKHNPGQTAVVAMPLVDTLHHVGVTRPKQHITSRDAQRLRQGRAPSATTDDSDCLVAGFHRQSSISRLCAEPSGADQRCGHLIQRPARTRREV